MCSFDTAYRNDYGDQTVVRISSAGQRIALTRDRRQLHRKLITHGCWVRSIEPDRQLLEVIQRFDLAERICPIQRCLDCNGKLRTIDKQSVVESLAASGNVPDNGAELWDEAANFMGAFRAGERTNWMSDWTSSPEN